MTGTDPYPPRTPFRHTANLERGTLTCMIGLPLLLAVAAFLRMPHASYGPVLVYAAALPVGWCLLATLVTWASSRNLRVRFAPVTGDRHVLGEIRVAVELINHDRHLPSTCIDVHQVLHPPDEFPYRLISQYVDMVPARKARSVGWKVALRLRGKFRMGDVVLAIHFPGSLMKVTSVFQDGREWIASPAIYRLRGEVRELLGGRRQSTGRPVLMPTALEEFAGVREYRPGDNPRLISWRTSVRLPGHLDILAIREFEDPGAEDVCLILDSCVGDPPEEKLLWQFEKAVSFTAALIRLLSEHRYRVTFITMGPGNRPVEMKVFPSRTNVWQVEHLLAGLVPIRDPRPIRDRLFREIRSGHGCLLFVSLDLTAEEERDRRLPIVSILPTWIAPLTREVVGT